MSMPYIYIEEGKAEDYLEHLQKAFYHLRKALHCMEEEGLGEEMEKIRHKFMKEMMGERRGRMNRKEGPEPNNYSNGPGFYRTATGYKEKGMQGQRGYYADEYEESHHQKMGERMNRKKQMPFDPEDWDGDYD